MQHMRQFGDTGLTVSALGFGAANLGDPRIEDSHAGRMLNEVLDLGINLIDTARAYGLSEERIGKHISHRRSEFVLSTKVGYGISGFKDWTYDCVKAGVDEALKRLHTDYLDIVHLHTCGLDLLHSGEVIAALEEAKSRGKIRVIAYAGDNSEVQFAISSERFGSVMTSINLCDQRFLHQSLTECKDKRMGVIAKRPLANAPWRFESRPVGHYCEEYWQRLRAMNIDTQDLAWNEIALRFSAFTYGVDSCVVGTTSLDHLKDNLASIDKGKLPQQLIDSLRTNFREHDFGWVQLV